LLSRELDDPAQKEFTNLIIEQADRLRSLVDRLLGPQRPTQHSLHNIHQVVQKVYKLVEIALPANIQLKRDYDPSIPDIEMDPDQMQQAVLNILQNAVQALEHTGGEILIRTRTQHQVTIGSQRHKLVLTLSIIDNGPGIPPELMDTPTMAQAFHLSSWTHCFIPWSPAVSKVLGWVYRLPTTLPDYTRAELIASPAQDTQNLLSLYRF